MVRLVLAGQAGKPVNNQLGQAKRAAAKRSSSLTHVIQDVHVILSSVEKK